MIQLSKMRVRWTGVSDLIMHRGGLADPLDEHSKLIKQIAGKRKKTDDDLVELAHREFIGCIYYDLAIGPYVPTDNIHAAIVAGAKASKQGRAATAAIFISSPKGNEAIIPVDDDGPRDPEEMWNDPMRRFVFTRGVRIKNSRVMRTRCKIPAGWQLKFILEFDHGLLDATAVETAMLDCGARVGFGDWRPKYGRFTVDTKLL
jgi:hypothetical protein